ncbi:unnamed protein product, partial [Prorocentrum cordatum]
EKLVEKAAEVAKQEALCEKTHSEGNVQQQSFMEQLIFRNPEQLALDGIIRLEKELGLDDEEVGEAAKKAAEEAKMNVLRELRQGAMSYTTQLQEHISKAKELAANSKEATRQNAKKRSIDDHEAKKVAGRMPPPPAAAPVAPGGGQNGDQMADDTKRDVDMGEEALKKTKAKVADGTAAPAPPARRLPPGALGKAMFDAGVRVVFVSNIAIWRPTAESWLNGMHLRIGGKKHSRQGFDMNAVPKMHLRLQVSEEQEAMLHKWGIKARLAAAQQSVKSDGGLERRSAKLAMFTKTLRAPWIVAGGFSTHLARFATAGDGDLLGDARIVTLTGDLPTCYKADAEPSLVDLALASPEARARVVDPEPVADASWRPRRGQQLRIRTEIGHGIARKLEPPTVFCHLKLDTAKPRDGSDKGNEIGPIGKHEPHRSSNSPADCMT